jgi:hypothetical protein
VITTDLLVSLSFPECPLSVLEVCDDALHFAACSGKDMSSETIEWFELAARELDEYRQNFLPR